MVLGGPNQAHAQKDKVDPKLVGKWGGKDGGVNVDLEIKSDGDVVLVVVADGTLYGAGTPQGKFTKGKGKAWQFKQDERKVDITIEPNDDGTSLMVAGSVAFGKNTIKAKLAKSKK